MTVQASPEPAGEEIGRRAGVPVLRPYQLDAGTALEASFFGDGKNRLLIKKPTGTGKTVWFAALLRSFPQLKAWLDGFDQKGAKVLVIAHREELLDQAQEKISRANRGVMVGIEQGDRRASRYCDVIVAGIQTLAAQKFKRLKNFTRHHTPRIVIIDEAHHSAAATYRTALVHLGFLPPADASDAENIEAATETDVEDMKTHLAEWDTIAPKDRLLIGVTATPNRTDAIGLGCVYQAIAYAYDLKQAIADGYLTPIVPWVVETTNNLDDVKLSRGDFNQRDLAIAVNTAHRNALAVQAWANYAADLQTIVFTVNVDHAEQLAKEYQRVGVTGEVISGETEKWRRRDILAAYKRGSIQVLTNAMLLTEGTDLPATACIVHAKPTKSPTLYEQMTGRGLRVHPDDPAGPDRLAAIANGATLIKPHCVLIDLVDIARRHSLITSPILYGLPPNINTTGEDLATLAQKLDEILERFPGFNPEEHGRITFRDLEVRASTFDIFSVPSLGKAGAGLRYPWSRVKDEFRLQYPWQDGVEVLTVRRDVLGHYELTATIRPADGSTPRQRILAPEVPDARRAMQIGEMFIIHDRRAVNQILDKNAAHRQRDATDRQLGRLRALGCPLKKRLSIVEASHLIDIYEARRRR